MKGFEKHFENNWKRYVVGLGILLLIILFSYITITQHLIGQTKIDYNLAFDNINCCMSYDTLSSILGEGQAWIWDPDESRVTKSAYSKSKINTLNPVGNQTIQYEFSNGEYVITTEGTKLTKAILQFNIPGRDGITDVLKQINGCVC
jgi:hypothetical protein